MNLKKIYLKTIRSIILVIIALTAASPVFAGWKDVKTAYTGVSSKLQDNEIDISAVNESLFSALNKTGIFQLPENELTSKGLNLDQAIEAGRKAGAEKVLTASLYKINDKYYLLLKGTDISNNQTELNEFVSGETQSELVEKIPELMNKIQDKLASSGQQPTQTGTLKKKKNKKEPFKIQNSLKAGIFYQDGYTLYKIGGIISDLSTGATGDLGYDISQLKFPLSTEYLQLQYLLALTPKFSLELKFAGKVPVAYRTAGYMEDSDWGIWYLQGAPWGDYYTLDVFSSDETVIDYLWKGSAESQFLFPNLKPFLLNLHVGLEDMYMHFKVIKLDQWYPSYDTYKAYLDPAYAQHDTMDGSIDSPLLEYSFNKFSVYGGIELGFDAGFLSGSSKTSVLVSYIADRDDHILRSKLSEGSILAIGARETLSLSLNYANWILTASGSGEYHVGTGTQTQRFYKTTSETTAGSAISIQEKYELAFWAAGLTVGYRL